MDQEPVEEPLGVARLRIAAAALVFAVWRRPWRIWRELDGPTRWLLTRWTAVLAVMNSVFYLAIDRLPLGAPWPPSSSCR